jgi:hypothetical protein
VVRREYAPQGVTLVDAPGIDAPCGGAAGGNADILRRQAAP